MDNYKQEPRVKRAAYNELGYDYEESLDEPIGQEDGVHDEQEDECYRKITELTKEDILALEFNSESDACKFYSNYARSHGFVIRKDNVRRDQKKEIIKRQYVCNKQGWRNKMNVQRINRVRDHRPLTRTGCKASLCVYFDYETSKWRVGSFTETHNHELTPSRFTHLVRGYRRMSDADKAQANSFHQFGVRTCHIMGYMVGQKGGYDRVGFTKKDLYNHFDKQNRMKIKDGDSHAVMSYLQAKADHDPLLFTKASTKNRKLQNLFWADGQSIIDYKCFGDVLAFDTTYKKNKYNKPLVIFSGCNHHGQTTIFGCALVSDETIETYRWVLQTFLEAMSNQHPKGVVTDGDGAMKEAIKEVFPGATHRLCAWHLHKNACENIKNTEFLEDFKLLIYGNFTKSQFEDRWKEVVMKHELSNNNWVLKTYENKSMWATAYLRDNFFGGIRTTSQCEGINSLIKSYIRKKCSLVEFMHNFHIALREYRNNELKADYETLCTLPMMTTSLEEIEMHAAKVFTRKIFNEVRNEIVKSGKLNVIHHVVERDKVVLKMNRFKVPNSEYEVVYDKSNKTFVCGCRLIESRGIPCCHVLSAMKYEHIDRLPDSLILKRWRQDAKREFISQAGSYESDCGDMSIFRSGALVSACNWLCHLASKNIDDFTYIRDEIFKLTSKLENKSEGPKKVPSVANVIGDPSYVKTKGAPKKRKYSKKKRCSNCRKTGHTILTCKQRHDETSKEDSAADLVSMENDLNESNGVRAESNDVKQSDGIGYAANDVQNATTMENKVELQKPKRLRRKGNPSSQKFVKSKKQKSEARQPEVQAPQVNAYNAQTSNAGLMPNYHGMRFYPQYPSVPGYLQFPQISQYAPYGGFPMYPHIQPYFPGPDSGNSWRVAGANFQHKNG